MEYEFIAEIKSVILEKLNDYKGHHFSSYEIGEFLCENEVASGSWYCNAQKAVEELCKYYQEVGSYQAWYKCGMGNDDYFLFYTDKENYFHSVEAFHVRFMATAVECILNNVLIQLGYDFGYGSKKIEIDDDFISKVEKGLESINQITDFWDYC